MLSEILFTLDYLLADLDSLQADEQDEDRQILLSQAFDLIDAGFDLLDKVHRRDIKWDRKMSKGKRNEGAQNGE